MKQIEATATVGVRERSKQERRDRIIMAARELFSIQGYDETTLRQIAIKAGLGLATLFNYISNKRDLIYLVWNEKMDDLVDRSLASPRPWQTFPDKILSTTEMHYRLFAQDPMLSRILLSEVMLQAPGLHLSRYLEVRLRLIRGWETLIAEAQRSGEVASEQPAEFLARQLYFTFSSAARWWLTSPEPLWRAGQREFECLLLSQMRGLAPGSTTPASVPSPVSKLNGAGPRSNRL